MQPSNSPADLLNNFWDFIHKNVEKFSAKDFIITNEGRLTFGEVISIANSIKTALSTLPPKTGVGLILNDPLKITPSMLGVLKAGHHFVVLDVSFPVETIQSMLIKAEISTVIIENKVQNKLNSSIFQNKVVINMDEIDLNSNPNVPDHNPSPEDWVQILFTSGTTGTPKGAIETYRYLCESMHGKSTRYGFESSDRLIDLSRFTFSAAHTTFFGALLIGMTIYYHNLKEYGFNELSALIRREQITKLNATVTVFRSWINTLESMEVFPNIDHVHIGAEKSTAHDFELIRKHFPNIKFFRLGFGATESNSVASVIVGRDFDFSSNEVPCGNPHQGVKVLIWDENGKTLPVGKEGEIVVYSNAMALGYINEPELTVQKFIPDPNNPDYQYYKTGDLGKLRHDGQLLHLGRIDNQIKIKGVRIELESIERHMLAYPGVEQTAFRVFEDDKGNKKLTAYFTSEEGTTIPISDLRRELIRHLPIHQIPHFFLQLDKMPLTRNGKMDRNQLPRPSMKRPSLSHPYVAPTTELESTLVRIWEEEIGIDGIGVTDDFFDVGGDSLIGVLLFIRIEKELNRSLPVSTLLTASTVRAQANAISSSNPEDDFSPLIAVRQKGSRHPLFFIPGRGGYPTRINHLVKHLDPNTPVYALQDLLDESSPKPLRTIEAVAAFYLNEIKKVFPQGPYVLVGESVGGKVSLEMANMLIENGEPHPELIMLDTYHFTGGGKKVSDWNKPSYYQMLIEKHLKILIQSDRRGRLEYLKFYRDNFSGMYRRFLQKLKMLGNKSTPNILGKIDNTEKKYSNAVHIHHPRPYPGKVALVKAMRGPNAGDPTNGWENVDIGELIIHPLDCYHGSILFEPAVTQLAQILNTYINQEEQ